MLKKPNKQTTLLIFSTARTKKTFLILIFKEIIKQYKLL